MGSEFETAEAIVRTAIDVLKAPPEMARLALDALPAPVYVTDADGVLIDYNRACVEFAGRTPAAGIDRWCVSWKLYSTGGDPMRHDECPMAVALRECRMVRGADAFAERPDGTMVRFRPHPTPYFNDDGSLAGGVNVLIDITRSHRLDELREQAARCRRLIKSAMDRRTLAVLTEMVAEYEAEAEQLIRME